MLSLMLVRGDCMIRDATVWKKKEKKKEVIIEAT